MWLMTVHGFYSIVEKQPGKFHIRGRERQDLENLVERIPLGGAVVIDTPSADYAARIIGDGELVQRILGFLGDSLHYRNFKGCIDATPGQERKPYHEVWQVMADALGAYGQSR